MEQVRSSPLVLAQRQRVMERLESPQVEQLLWRNKIKVFFKSEYSIPLRMEYSPILNLELVNTDSCFIF